jgi:hypothetical protein
VSDIKNTIEQLVLEKNQAQQNARTLTSILVALVVASPNAEVRLTRTQLVAPGDGVGLKLDKAGRGGIKLTVVEPE